MNGFVEESAVLETTATGGERPEAEAPVFSSNNPTYPGLVNQDLVNLFYRAAAIIGENGWYWIVRCGLRAIAESRDVRFESYRGPQVSELHSLTLEQRSALENELAQLSV